MFNMPTGQRIEWTVLVLFCGGMGWWTFVDVGHTAGIWFMLMPPIMFLNERVLGRLVFPYQAQVQTAISVGYMAILTLLIAVSR